MAPVKPVLPVKPLAPVRPVVPVAPVKPVTNKAARRKLNSNDTCRISLLVFNTGCNVLV